MAMAALAPRAICDTCKNFIDPGAAYVVQPDIAGVGPDVVTCLGCGPVDTPLYPICEECDDPIYGEARAVHQACVEDDD